VLLAVATFLAIGGLATVGHSASRPGRAVSGAAASARSVSHRTQASRERERYIELTGPRPAAPMGFSVPVHIALPQAGIDADVTSIGLAVTRSAPGVLPLTRPEQVAWYDLGPAPGQLGTALVDAHVNVQTSAAVRPGETVEVTRADHSIAVFTVDEAEAVPDWRAPAQAQEISDTAPYSAPYAVLSLVTCAGSLDTWRHGCLDHTVIHAHLTAERGQGLSGRAY
jgi:hypothetical protein